MPIDVQRMVDVGDDGHAAHLHEHDAVAERLHVVDDVEAALRLKLTQTVEGANAERGHAGEHPVARRQELVEVEGPEELARMAAVEESGSNLPSTSNRLKLAMRSMLTRSQPADMAVRRARAPGGPAPLPPW